VKLFHNNRRGPFFRDSLELAIKCVCIVTLSLCRCCVGLTILIKLQTQSPGLITSEAAARIRATVVRISKSFASYLQRSVSVIVDNCIRSSAS